MNDNNLVRVASRSPGQDGHDSLWRNEAEWLRMCQNEGRLSMIVDAGSAKKKGSLMEFGSRTYASKPAMIHQSVADCLEEISGGV